MQKKILTVLMLSASTCFVTASSDSRIHNSAPQDRVTSTQEVEQQSLADFKKAKMNQAAIEKDNVEANFKARHEEFLNNQRNETLELNRQKTLLERAFYEINIQQLHEVVRFVHDKAIKLKTEVEQSREKSENILSQIEEIGNCNYEELQNRKKEILNKLDQLNAAKITLDKENNDNSNSSEETDNLDSEIAELKKSLDEVKIEEEKQPVETEAKLKELREELKKEQEKGEAAEKDLTKEINNYKQAKKELEDEQAKLDDFDKQTSTKVEEARKAEQDARIAQEQKETEDNNRLFQERVAAALAGKPLPTGEENPSNPLVGSKKDNSLAAKKARALNADM